MGELKQHQPPMTIDEQVENLKNIGLIVEDEEYAKKILNDISYFRLIKAYSLNLKSKNGMYEDKVTFEQIVELYLFNANFRQIIFPEIEKIEINVRCRIANYFAEQYGVLGYLEADNFVNPEYHQAFLDDIEEEIRRNSKAPFVKNFRDNYEGGNLPILLGDKDKTGKVKQYCTAWSEATGYPLHIIDDAAHFSNGDNAGRVNSEIEQFVIQTTVG